MFVLKYSFQSGALQKLLNHRTVVQDALVHLCEMVQRDAYTQSLVSLGLLDPPSQSQDAASSTSSCSNSSSYGTPKQHGYKVSYFN